MEKINSKELLKLDKRDLYGKVICFPTDTVYGVGALFDDSIAIEKIYRMKNRSKDKPLVNLCSSVSQIESLGIFIPDKARRLMDSYWPGALTIILKDGNKTTSFRMPDSSVSLKLIDRFSMIATTSVNESGEPELNSYEDINRTFGNHIDYFIDDEAVFSKVPSTVLDVSGEKIKILRQGNIRIDNFE